MMNKRLVNGLMLKAFILASLSIIWVLNSDIQAQDVDKRLPLEGKTLVIGGSVAFIIPAREQLQSADSQLQKSAKPWVWYAPTLPNLPGPEERWMFERFV
ncbi:MAG: hypothetical protein ACKO9Q_18540, partial [Pirellula sp.]